MKQTDRDFPSNKFKIFNSVNGTFYMNSVLCNLSGQCHITGRHLRTGFVWVLEILEKSLRGLKKFQGPGKRLKILKTQFDLLKSWKSA